ncbi:MAG: hypothetical protein GX488_08560 [Clostridiales bacterium]|nr:hypothetical protein [Clostridiales bacterium]
MNQDVHIGDKLQLIPETFTDTEHIIDSRAPRKPMKCTVVYVHSRKRYFTVKFENGIMESFLMGR